MQHQNVGLVIILWERFGFVQTALKIKETRKKHSCLMLLEIAVS